MSEHALAPGHAREYETIYILRPNIDKEQMDKLTGRVGDAIEGFAGQLSQAELWGRRRLAYPVKKHTRGLYVYLKFLGRGETVAELERQLRLSDTVLRYQTIQLRTNVPLKSVEKEDVELAFELPTEPMEADITLVKELGLDAPVPERRRYRDDRRERRNENTEASAEAAAPAANEAAAAATGDAADGAAKATAADGAKTEVKESE
ncbi:MAG TPA: 30S ribosomal protein S6 [Sorangium sp.]|nr:30S ribosomal protein S6 [Sorangium sp.]